jgi:uncharacterized protein YegP (UPF0339 family)
VPRRDLVPFGTLISQETQTMHFILYKDNRGEWRWTFKAANHEPICVSSEGYSSKQGALNSIALVRANAASSPIYDDSQKNWM